MILQMFCCSRYNSREVGIYVAMQIISKHLHPHPEYFKRIQERLWHDNTVNIAESKESHQGSNGIITRPRFSLARSSSANLPGGIVYFISNLPKMPKEIINYLTDNSLSSSVNFGPMPPRRVVSLKVKYLSPYWLIRLLKNFYFSFLY